MKPIALLTIVIVASSLLSCSADAPARNTEDVDATRLGDMPGDALGDRGGDDRDASLDGFPANCPPVLGAFGATCETNADCVTGFCVDAGGGRVCTEPCLSACDALCDGRPTFCRSLLLDDGDVAFVCLPEPEDLCAPCTNDGQCANGLCLTFGDGETGCGRDCATATDCPEGYACGDVDPDHAGQCVPQNGTCSCNAGIEGLIRPCSIENAVGACAGRQFCDADEGWSECDAATPAEEICNGFDDDCDGLVDNGVEIGGVCDVLAETGDDACDGVLVCQGSSGEDCLGAAPTPDVCDGFDNNCDGVIDEDFVDEADRYVLFEHCGACGNSCADRFPLAAEVVCDGARDEPACVIVRCQEGFQRVGDTQCVPFQSNVCEACADDAECSLTSPGAACVTITDTSDESNLSRVCGRDCAAGGIFGTDCPEGFTCQTFAREDEGEIKQCVPIAGTCACVDNPAGFSVPCRVTIADGELAVGSDERGEVSCGGSKACVGDEFGACELPADVCDGFDNDCSGRIDDDLRDEQGRYTSDEHCGRCNNDCTARFDADLDHAEGLCEVRDEVAGCVMGCLEGFVDLFGGTDDGCECEILSEDDFPDDDPESCLGERCDANCDGVDGDVSVALFVSKTGRPDGAATRADPLDSIGAAIALAIEDGSGVRDIYVATGVYSENLVVADGISLYGGYSLDFVTRDAQQNPTTVFGVLPDSGSGEVGTVTARDIVSDTVVSGFSIFGFDAPPPPPDSSLPGNSSYAVYVADSTEALQLVGNRIVAANGGRGGQGDPGTFGLSGDDGREGGLGVASDDGTCAGVTFTSGGTSGSSFCGSAGGMGGPALCPRASESAASYVPCDEGRRDDCLNDCGLTGAPGGLTQGIGDFGGNNAACVGEDCGQSGDPAYDFWTDSASCGLCGLQLCLRHIGGAGHNGRLGEHGSPGLGCDDVTGTVDVDTGLWLGNSGFDGIEDATNGGGGGGGSAGAGFDVLPGTLGCSDNLGGSGGGGGGGGCHGSPGGAGTAGGASFGLFVFYSATASSAPVLIDNEVVRGFGGPGGNGGPGGAGGRGGRGAEGGFAFPAQSFCTSPGGPGGNGGGGGAGAGGGGGCGGNAYGIFLFQGPNDLGDAAADWAADNDFPASGGGGPAGLGGTSIAAESRGGDGDDGLVVNVVVE